MLVLLNSVQILVHCSTPLFDCTNSAHNIYTCIHTSTYMCATHIHTHAHTKKLSHTQPKQQQQQQQKPANPRRFLQEERKRRRQEEDAASAALITSPLLSSPSPSQQSNVSSHATASTPAAGESSFSSATRRPQCVVDDDQTHWLPLGVVSLLPFLAFARARWHPLSPALPPPFTVLLARSLACSLSLSANLLLNLSI